jgi:signal transduction histidine kinase
VGFGPSPQSEAVGLGFGTRRASGLLQTVGYPLGVLLLTAVYYGAAHLGYALEFTGPIAGIVWLPVGVGISFLYLGGLRYWPGVLIGDLLVNNYSTLPVGSAIGQTCGNVLEVVLAALLIRRLVPNGSPLADVRRMGRLFASLVAGTAVSATVGLISARLGDAVTTDALPKLWRTWWLGDLCGALIVVPLVLAWYQPPSREWLRSRAGEGTLILIAIAGLSELALHTSRPVAYLVFPALVVAALRLGTRGATLALALAAGYAVWATTHYEGPFAFHSITGSVLATQLYIVAAAVSVLPLAALAAERDDVAARMRALRRRLVKAADVERRRIEHNLHDGAQQRLTALAVYLGIASEEARNDPERAAALFGRAERELLLAIDELRELAHGMDPPLLRKYGVATAVMDVAERSSVPVMFPVMSTARFDDTVESAAYFVLVEAITNAQKHSQAISIRASAELTNGTLAVEVVDDGVGGACENAGLGLQGLRDRVEALGGRFDVSSPDGGGTRISAAIPAIVVNR